MPLVLAHPNNDGTMNVMLVLGPESIERIKEKDPVEFNYNECPFAKNPPRVIGISYASDSEMTQMTQLARQGRTKEAIKMAMSGWKYRPELGDNDLPPIRY